MFVSVPYVKFPLELLEAMMRTNWASYQLRVYLAILRKTIGWGIVEENISVGLLAKMTGLAKPHVSRALRELAGRKMIQRDGYRTRVIMTVDAWQSLPVQAIPCTGTGDAYTGSSVAYTGDPYKEEETLSEETQEKREGAYTGDGCQKGRPEGMRDGYCEGCGKPSKELTDGLCIVCYRKVIPSPPPQLRELLRVIKCGGERE